MPTRPRQRSTRSRSRLHERTTGVDWKDRALWMKADHSHRQVASTHDLWDACVSPARLGGGALRPLFPDPAPRLRNGARQLGQLGDATPEGRRRPQFVATPACWLSASTSSSVFPPRTYHLALVAGRAPPASSSLPLSYRPSLPVSRCSRPSAGMTLGAEQCRPRHRFTNDSRRRRAGLLPFLARLPRIAARLAGLEWPLLEFALASCGRSRCRPFCRSGGALRRLALARYSASSARPSPSRGPCGVTRTMPLHRPARESGAKPGPRARRRRSSASRHSSSQRRKPRGDVASLVRYVCHRRGQGCGSASGIASVARRWIWRLTESGIGDSGDAPFAAAAVHVAGTVVRRGWDVDARPEPRS